MAPSLAQLTSACCMFGLDAAGDYDALHARVGAHLVDKLFASHASTPSTSSDDEAPRRREKRPLSESARRWHSFARHERPLVKQAGYTDNVAIVKEIAARYKRAKLVGTPAQPPLLEAPSPDVAAADGIKWALAELPDDQINEALAAHGIEPGEDAEANLDALAVVLI